MNADILVSMHNVHMTFNGTNGRSIEVLRNFSLHIAKREVVAIVGPSGCGKTTILKIIAGLLFPTQGEVTIAGLSPLDDRPRRTLSFMFQSPVLFPWLTVRQNVQLPGKLSGNSEATGRANSLIELVGLSGFEDAYPRQLSGGMQSRAALARAISSRPQLLLMDEPFGALDAMTRATMQDELLNILETSPTTVVLVTHSIDEAVYLSDRMVVLSSRPARILLDMPIQLPKPRNWTSKDDPAFLGYRARIQEILFDRQNHDGFFRLHGEAEKRTTR